MATGNACECTKRFVFQVLDGASLLFVLVLQGSILNFYIISHYKSSVNPYFWFIADFVCLFVFAGTLTKAYRHLKFLKSSKAVKIRHARPDNSSPGLTGSNADSINGSQVSHASSLKRLGLPSDLIGPLPLSYAAWMFYSVILTAKVGIILKSEIPNTLNKADFFGPQMLKLTIGLSAVIYLLLAEGHSEYSPGPKLVRSTCSHSAVELVDTISFLSILLVKDTTTLEDFVVALTAINFLLPTLPLYALSISGFGAKPIPLILLLIRDLLHLFLLDIPYLVVRVYFWIAYQQDISMFLMKNVFGIVIIVRSVYPDIIKILRKWRRNRVVRGSSNVERLELQKVNSSQPQNSGLVNVAERVPETIPNSRS
ncbi:transmembrane protein 121B-like [Hetaerina americana]|uniref:transmembrane protein 121B-like n=1 Tax=Hetaerina americana TaxID=62018 RepID=UPI003A7F51DA